MTVIEILDGRFLKHGGGTGCRSCHANAAVSQAIATTKSQDLFTL